MKQTPLLFAFFLASFITDAQEYNVRRYRVDRGLPSDVVKASVQDSLGYFWIATDEGLAKFDGISFSTYADALHSNYVKGFLRTRSNKLLLYGDLDFLEITNLGDTVVFRTVWPVSRVGNDSTLTFPKLVYEALNGDLWIAESQAVVRISKNSFTRYPFELSDRSPQFLRSFSFFEDFAGTIYTISFQGSVYRHDKDADEFTAVNEKLPYGVEFAAVWNNKLFVGALDGVYAATLKPGGGISAPERTIKTNAVSFISPLTNGQYFIATRTTEHFIGDIETGSVRPLGKSVNNINHVYTSTENDVWISSNDGWILMQENLFNSVSGAGSDFVESIAEDERTRLIYYATREILYSFDRKSGQQKVVLHIPGGYFQALLYSREGLWVTNAFRVMLYADGVIKRSYDFTKYGRFVTELSRDADGNIWLSIPGLQNAWYIDPAFALKHVAVPLGSEGVINVIKAGHTGVHIGSAGLNSYIFFKAYGDSTFVNISASLDALGLRRQFNVGDVAEFDGAVWMATSEGLLVMNDRIVRRVNLGRRFTELPTKLVRRHVDGRVIAENSFGLLLYDPTKHTVELFNESSGLLSNTVTARGVLVDKDHSLWIGTSKGLCYSVEPLTRMRPTPKPRFIEVYANGMRTTSSGITSIQHGSFISVRVSSITFPEEEVVFQYRLLPDTSWRNVPGAQFGLSSLPAGAHVLEVKAKKNGPYTWSEAADLNFTIEKPFWQNPWFYLLGLLLIFLLVFVTIVIMTFVNRQASQSLQRLINEKTEELTTSNNALRQLNDEKNSLIGIVAHDLKSPLQQMKGLHQLIDKTSSVDETAKKYLKLMEDSTVRLDALIGKILDIDAIESQKLNLKLEQIDVARIIDRVADRFAYDADRKLIKLSRDVVAPLIAVADAALFEQAFENLLSNAIKFSPRGRNVFIKAWQHHDRVICEVRDEGPGLTEKDKQKLFSKYQKLSARPTDGEPSTGLGLAIVKKYVSGMGGSVSCVSEHGKGAAFSITLRTHQ